MLNGDNDFQRLFGKLRYCELEINISIRFDQETGKKGNGGGVFGISYLPKIVKNLISGQFYISILPENISRLAVIWIFSLYRNGTLT